VNIDLHVHSNASDGTLSPIELLTLADRLKIGALAITDHDTIDGSKSALAAGIPDQLHFITGVEISASRPPSFPGPGSFHLLGYRFRTDDPVLNNILRKLQGAREQRNPRIIERLAGLGFDIRLEDAQAETSDKSQLGRPHIASAMVTKGFAGSINEAFDRYLGTGKPAYVDKYRISCSSAIRVISDAGGISVLAHPGLLNITDPHRLDRLIGELKSMGLQGIEVYYPEHTRAQTAQFSKMAIRHKLLVTGGTDFHGAIKPDIQLGIGRGDFSVPYELFKQLESASV